MSGATREWAVEMLRDLSLVVDEDDAVARVRFQQLSSLATGPIRISCSGTVPFDNVPSALTQIKQRLVNSEGWHGESNNLWLPEEAGEP